MTVDPSAVRTRVERELRENILPFWLDHTIDEEAGGFFGYLASDLTVDRRHDKGSVLCARILWTFSAAYRRYRDERYLAAARRAYDYLRGRFIDREHGGVYWMVDWLGRPSNAKKQVYANAFALYALSEYARATGDARALDEARALFTALERHAHDAANGGYIEARARDWSPLADMSLSERDLNAAKSMNTHLHLLEAYTNLLRAWDDPLLRARLAELIALTLTRIVEPTSASFTLFFDEAWRPLSKTVSFGHDIEGSWLLYEAAEALGDATVLESARATALRMAERVLVTGVDREHGGIYNEADSAEAAAAGDLSRFHTDKDWWPQAEAVVGFYNAFELTGDERFRSASFDAWRFIDAHLVDRTHGEWHWGVSRDGARVIGAEKVGPWKCPYHSSRMCLEIIDRIEGGSRNGWA